MWNAYENGDKSDEHGVFIPPLVLVLLWWKRKELLALPNRVWSPALLLLGFALALHMTGYLIQQQRVSIVALFVGVYALMGLAWGPAWLRASFFPYFLVAFCVPIATIGEPITFPWRILVCKIVAAISADLGNRRDPLRHRALQRIGSYQYEVAAACSGLRSVVAILCLSTVYGFVTFEKNWKRMLMIAAAFPLAVVGNVIRMMFIIVAAEISGQSAGNYVHEHWFFSLVPYVPAIAGVMALGYWLRERTLVPELPMSSKPV